MKGIILAGGMGSRLYPSTLSVSKQLLPIYDKPMIYYPLSLVMMAGIKEILIITTKKDQLFYMQLLGNGQSLGIKLDYAIQEKPEGLSQAFMIGRDFIGKDSVLLVLGDNILYGDGLISILKDSKNFVEKEKVAKIFGYKVSNPESFGIIELNDNDEIVSLEEKPQDPKSKIASIGIYFYPNEVIDLVKKVNKSSRGEYEITSLNQIFLRESKLHVEILGRGYAWLDTGTPDSMLGASEFVKTIEQRQGYKIACIEEISFSNGWISKNQLKEIAEPIKNSDYGKYVMELSNE